MSRVKRPAWLSRNLAVLSGVSFLQDSASELTYPVLPIFITSVLGAPAAVVGIVEGFAEAVAAIFKLLAGTLSDGRRKRPFIAFGYGVAALGKLLIAVATAWPMVLVGRGVDRVGKGVRGAPRDALLLVGVPKDRWGSAFGLHRAADTAGAVVGPLMGLALYSLLHHHIRPLLAFAVIPAVLSALLVFAVREDRVAPRAPAPVLKPAVKGPSLTPAGKSLLAMLVVFSLVNVPDALLLLRAHNVGLGVQGVLVAYVIYNTSAALLALPMGALSDRITRRGIFSVGLVIFAVSVFGIAHATTRLEVFIWFFVYGAFPACTDGVGKAWIATMALPDRHGGAQGLYQGLSGAGLLLAGTWAGLAWHGNGQIPLTAAALGAMACAVLIIIGGRRWEVARADRS